MSTPTRGLRAFLLSYLHQHPGEEVFIRDLQVAAKESGQDWTSKQIQTSFSNILADKKAGKGRQGHRPWQLLEVPAQRLRAGETALRGAGPGQRRQGRDPG